MSFCAKAISPKKLLLRHVRTGAFGRDEKGVTAVEFGLLALPFFAIIGAILETSFVFLASQILDGAVNDSARLIRTGQAQVNSFTAASFRSAICDGLYGMFDCSAVKVRVSVVANFSSATLGNVVDTTNGNWTMVEQYDDGAGLDVILVEAYYKWPVFMDFFNFNLASLPDNTRLLSSVRVFRNEPF